MIEITGLEVMTYSISLAATSGAVTYYINNKFFKSRAERIAERDTKKRINIIIEKLPDSMWYPDGNSIFPNDMKPVTFTTKDIQEKFFASEILNIDEVFEIMTELQRDGKVRLLREYRYKKDALWRSVELYTPRGDKFKQHDDGVTSHGTWDMK